MQVELRDLLPILAILINTLIVPYLKSAIELAIAKSVEKIGDKYATKDDLRAAETRLTESIDDSLCNLWLGLSVDRVCLADRAVVSIPGASVGCSHRHGPGSA